MYDGDLQTYQTAETEWRYDSHVNQAKEDLARARALVADAQRRLDWLTIHPPLRHLFNWSA